MKSTAVGIAVVAALGGTAPRALACSFSGPPAHQVDRSLAATDTEAPGVVRDVSYSVSRGQGAKRSGCGERSATSCDDIGSWTLMFEPPEDDQSEPEEIGYVVEVAEGTTPEGLTKGDPLTEGPIAGSEGEVTLSFIWVDGSSDQQEPLSFAVVIRAVDRAGNVGEPSEPIRIRHGGSSDGCAIGSGSSAFGWIVVALFGAVGTVRRGLRRSVKGRRR